MSLQPSPIETPVQQKRRVVIVEDHPITRRGFVAVINAEPDLEVCGETDSAPKALDLIRATKPDIAVIDISLKNVSGIELMKNLKVMMPTLPFLAATMHDENVYAERVLRAGARGYLMKHEAREQIVTAIRKVLNNELYVSENLRDAMMDRYVSNKKPDEGLYSIDRLSDREIEIFGLIGEGFTTRQIAATLNLSGKTVESYREHLKLKLGLKSAAELIRRAVQWSQGEGVARL